MNTFRKLVSTVLLLSLFVTLPILAADLPLAAGGEVVTYYHADHLGSTRAVTDAAGALVEGETHDFYPYGKEINTPTQTKDKELFTGKMRDAESGLDNLGARFFSSNLGRFLTNDPILNLEQAKVIPLAWNRYVYCIDNPVNLIDPDGCDFWDSLADGIAGFADHISHIPFTNITISKDIRDGLSQIFFGEDSKIDNESVGYAIGDLAGYAHDIAMVKGIGNLGNGAKGEYVIGEGHHRVVSYVENARKLGKNAKLLETSRIFTTASMRYKFEAVRGMLRAWLKGFKIVNLGKIGKNSLFFKIEDQLDKILKITKPILQLKQATNTVTITQGYIIIDGMIIRLKKEELKPSVEVTWWFGHSSSPPKK